MCTKESKWKRNKSFIVRVAKMLKAKFRKGEKRKREFNRCILHGHWARLLENESNGLEAWIWAD